MTDEGEDQDSITKSAVFRWEYLSSVVSLLIFVFLIIAYLSGIIFMETIIQLPLLIQFIVLMAVVYVYGEKTAEVAIKVYKEIFGNGEQINQLQKQLGDAQKQLVKLDEKTKQQDNKGGN